MPDVPSPAGLNRSFARRLNEYLSGVLGKQMAILVTDTPEVLRGLGIRPLPIIINDGTIEKVLRNKHGIHPDTLRKLPSHLLSPVMVFDSATEPGTLVVMTGLKDQKGHTIVAALHPSRRYGRHEVHILASFYGKDRNRWFVEQVEAGRLRYIDKKRASDWLMTLGLQLPKVRGTNQGSNSNILTDEDFVKENRDFPDIVQRFPQATGEPGGPGPSPG